MEELFEKLGENLIKNIELMHIILNDTIVSNFEVIHNRPDILEINQSILLNDYYIRHGISDEMRSSEIVNNDNSAVSDISDNDDVITSEHFLGTAAETIAEFKNNAMLLEIAKDEIDNNNNSDINNYDSSSSSDVLLRSFVCSDYIDDDNILSSSSNDSSNDSVGDDTCSCSNEGYDSQRSLRCDNNDENNDTDYNDDYSDYSVASSGGPCSVPCDDLYGFTYYHRAKNR